MRKLFFVCLLFCLCRPGQAQATPWDEAGRAPDDCELVVGWTVEDSIDFKPFWKRALQIDAASRDDQRPRLSEMLAVTGFSLEQWLSNFDGTGSWVILSESQGYILNLGLAQESRLNEELAARMSEKTADGKLFKKIDETLFVQCDEKELSFLFGAPVGAPNVLANHKKFAAARAKLGKAGSSVVVYQPLAQGYRALSIDLKSGIAEGFWAFPESGQAPAGLKAEVLRLRPEELKTFIAVDLPWLQQTLAQLKTESPGVLSTLGGVLSQQTLEGGLFEVVEAQGLMGMDSDPLSFLMAGAQDVTMYAGARYKSLPALEKFLTALEQKTRLRTLSECKENIHNLTFCLARYEVDLKKGTPETVEALAPRFLRTIPKCPSAGRSTYAIGKDAQGSYVYCAGHHHPQTRPNFPRSGEGGATAGELRDVPELVTFSRLDGEGRAAYRLVSGQRIMVESRERFVSLSDGEQDKEFLLNQPVNLPDLARKNLQWGGERLVYLDFTELAAGVPLLQQFARQGNGYGATSLMAEALLDSLNLSGETQGSNALRWEPDGLAYRGSGVWAQPLVATGVAFTPLWIDSAIRREQVQLANVCRTNVLKLATALKAYSEAGEGPYPENLSQLVPDFLPELPVCPVVGKDTYSESYRWNLLYNWEPRSGVFELFCKGHSHKGAGWNEDEPFFNLDTGLRPKLDSEPASQVEKDS